jgi:hypothetical protein
LRVKTKVAKAARDGFGERGEAILSASTERLRELLRKYFQ